MYNLEMKERKMETAKVGDKIKLIETSDKYSSVSMEGQGDSIGDMGIIKSITQKHDEDVNGVKTNQRTFFDIEWDKNKKMTYRIVVPGDTFSIL